ncbi:MAG: aldehyde ferredoxin oxidoreductase C-terminal domain-containing protein [Methanobacteriota archaeon]
MNGPESIVDCNYKPVTLKTEKGFETGNTKHQWDLKKMRESHRILAEMKYERRPVARGYAGRTLYISLSKNEIKEKPVSEEMKNQFTGGKGFDLKLLYDAIKPSTRWDSEENELVMAAGPLCGTTQYSGMGKCLAVTISPLTNVVCDSNAGGYFAPYLKFAGFDAIEIQGKAKEDVAIIVDGREGVVRIETAPLEEVNAHLVAEQLTYMYAAEDTDVERQKVAVVSAGRGSEHSYWGCLNISFFDPRRKVARLKQHGRGGLGTVFRNKKIKALVARIEKFDGTSNDPADPDRLAATGLKHHREMRDLDRDQCNMRVVGTGNIVEVMDAYDLLPTENYRFGSHPKAANLHSPQFYKRFTQVIPDGCWYGCTMACAKVVDGFEVMTGPYKGMKFSVDGPEYENSGGCANMGLWDPDWVIEWNFYCDCYGIDTISFATGMAYYMEMYEYGILTKERCGGLELVWGNGEAILEFMHRIARGDTNEFIQTGAKGIRRTKDWLLSKGWGDPYFIENCGMENKGLEFSEYVCKESLAQQGGYGLTNKGPQHDEAWLIFMDMVNKQIPTFADKAEALHYFPMWRTWFGLVGLCKLPWNDVTPPSNAKAKEPAKIPEHVQNYADMLSGTVGKEFKPADLIAQSERVYNFQRSMNVWMGRGTRKDDKMPFRALGPVTEMEYLSRKDRYDKQLAEIIGVPKERLSKMITRDKLALLKEYRIDQYEKLTDAVYHRRGWTPNGIPTPEKMKSLGFADERLLGTLQKKIEADEKAGLNKWGGKYKGDEKPPGVKGTR